VTEGYIYKRIAAGGGYLTVLEMASLLGVSARAIQLNIKRGRYTQVKQVSGNGSGRGGKVWQIHISDPTIPNEIKIAYYEAACAPHAAGDKAPFQAPGPAASISQREQASWRLVPAPSLQVRAVLPEPVTYNSLSDEEVDVEIYSSAPQWARKKADKYLLILDGCEGLKGEDLKNFVAAWNHKHPEIKTSYDSILEARKRRCEEGIQGLLGKYGRGSGKTKIIDDYYEYFKKLYLKEGGPSVHSCWIATLGYAKTTDSKLEVAAFPSQNSFLRRLEREIPKDAIYMGRHGREAWNRKYGNYIDRDYSGLEPGECIVGDHCQIDVAIMLPTGRVVFPWVTSWRCFLTGKWLGWVSHPEPPSSDHIFQSFYYAVKDYGCPTDAYIDNGKDYRCRDFAGGRRYYKVTIDERKATSMLALLGIRPHFSIPRNAQAKTIERDFGPNKVWFSKNMPGYRGGNVKERPEGLGAEIKAGRILHWGEYETLIDSFIVNVLNRMPSEGKNLKGMSRDELWNARHREVRMISPEALRLFCTRTSKEVTIGKNGVRDSQIGCYYWNEAMSGLKGTRVYLRRDIRSYQEAWVFRAESDEFLCKASIGETAAALCRTDIEKSQLKNLMSQKKQAEKITKAFIKLKDTPLPSDVVAHMAAGVEAVNKLRGYVPQEREVKIITAYDTPMDKAVKKERQLLKTGTDDFSLIQPPKRKAKIRLFESE
jgi:putative transposase